MAGDVPKDLQVLNLDASDIACLRALLTKPLPDRPNTTVKPF
jgi:hypothetical protein